MSITLNPMLPTNAAGGFSVLSDGYVQGMALQESAVRYQLANGFIGANETYPMWGGVAVTETIKSDPRGNQITRATTSSTNGVGSINGFAVANQAHSWLTTPQSPVPSGQPGQTANFYRLGSLAKIPVKCDPAFAATLVGTQAGGALEVAAGWDFVGQQLIAAETATAAVTVSSATVSTTTGLVTLTLASAVTVPANDYINLSGFVPLVYNGSWQVAAAVSASTTVTFYVPVATAVANPTITTKGQLNAFGGTLNINVIGLNIGNSRTIVYNDPLAGGNGNLYWNETGTVALIQI